MKHNLQLLLTLFISVILQSIIYSQATVETGAMGVVINNYGRIRAYLPDYANGVKQLERISPLVGVGSTSVFDYQNDFDTEEATALVASPKSSDYEITGAYNNAYSAAPPKVIVKYNVYLWKNTKFAVVKWTIKNKETAQLKAKIGLDVIMALNNTYGYDTVVYNATNKLIRNYRDGIHAGIKFLSHPLKSLYSFEWYDGYSEDSLYWNKMNYNSIQSKYIGGVEGPVTIPSTDFVNINPEQEVVFYFALAFGNSEQDLNTQIAEAEKKYGSLTTVEFSETLPIDFVLYQNYPNPFNPETSIKYSIPNNKNENNLTTLKIYDITGCEVATLVNENQLPGNYEVKFNAKNLSSGIYFYTIKHGNYSQTRKMILMK